VHRFPKISPLLVLIAPLADECERLIKTEDRPRLHLYPFPGRSFALISGIPGSDHYAMHIQQYLQRFRPNLAKDRLPFSPPFFSDG
jgi:hypothetical protein